MSMMIAKSRVIDLFSKPARYARLAPDIPRVFDTLLPVKKRKFARTKWIS